MSDNAKPPRRRVWKYVLFLVIAGLLVLAALAWYTTRDSFQAAVRRRLLSEITRTTGGTAAAGACRTAPFQCRAERRGHPHSGRGATGQDHDAPTGWERARTS